LSKTPFSGRGIQPAALIILLAGTLAAFGGTYRRFGLPLVAAVVGLAALSPRRVLVSPFGFRILDSALMALIVGVVIQLVPFPVWLRQLLSPHSLRLAGMVQLNALAGAAPLSIDPIATWHAFATLIAAVVTFRVTRGMFAEGGVRRVCRAILLIGAVAGALALFQRATTPTLLYGVWSPQDPGAQPLGPFVNRNHFATWLIMAIPVATGYLLAHLRLHLANDPRHRAGMRAVAHAAGVTLLLSMVLMLLALSATLSRSGIVGLAVATVAGASIVRGRLRRQGQGRSLIVLGAAAVVLIVLALVDPGEWATRVDRTLHTQPTDRLTIWRETLPMIRDFWLTGTGAGAYGTGMLFYQQTYVSLPHLRSYAHFNQAHSHYLQVVAEGGLLLAVPALIAIGALVVQSARALSRDRGETYWIRAGAATGLIAVATQSIWETGLRLPANALLCATLAALVVYRRERQDLRMGEAALAA